MTTPITCICESCSTQAPLYLLRLETGIVAALCLPCHRNPDVKRITEAQEAERKLEHSGFRKQRRKKEAGT
jgi:hypothetical protein